MPRLTSQDALRVEQLTDDVWADVFNLMDSELNLTSDDAGHMAAACVKAVREYLTKVWEVG